MTPTELIALLPAIVVAVTVILLMLVVAFYRHHALTVTLTLLGLIAAFVTLLPAWSVVPQPVTSLLIIDRYALFFTGLLLATAFVVAALSFDYLEKQGGQREEFYLLLLLATLGAVVLVSAAHFAAFFLGLEVLSVSLYALIAYPRRARSLEGGLKYLTLAAVAASFALFGIALIYADKGTMSLGRLALSPGGSSLWLVGFGLIVVGIAFKLALVPFHMWIPDVFEGAPAPATAFIASASKAAVFAFFLRLFIPLNLIETPVFYWSLSAIAIASMLGGSVLALRQRNVKRMLAYSSIAQLGYVMVAFLAGGAAAIVAAAFFLVAYTLTNLAAFGSVALLSSGERDADARSDYQGLYWLRPGVALVMTVALFSLAGIPLTAGFVGKFLVLAAGAGATAWLLAIVLVVSSGISLFIYLKVIVVMFRARPEDVTPAARLSWAVGVLLGMLLLLLIGLGVYPEGLIQLILNVIS